MKTVLLDGDILAYQMAAAAETQVEFDGIVSLYADPAIAAENIDNSLAGTMRRFKADAIIVALTDSGSNWRKGVLPSYKSNRAGTRKPLILSHLRKHLVDNHAAKIKPSLEGDDILGILSTHPTIVAGEKIIISADKDMRTIPGLFCRAGVGTGEIERISEDDADYHHMLQTLTGDPTDGYKGCPGVGPKKAEAILGAEGDTWANVVAAFTKAKLTEEDALVQARVARILRHTDFNFRTGEPKLWTPPPPETR